MKQIHNQLYFLNGQIISGSLKLKVHIDIKPRKAQNPLLH